jgi:hypothetical protein
MATHLADRVGGRMQPEILRQILEGIRDAPVKAASQMLAHRLNPVLDVLDDEQPKTVICNCLKAWVEVWKRLYTWIQSPSRLTQAQAPDNLTRIAQHLGRIVPEHTKSWEELVVGFAVCRIRPLGRPTWVPRGLRGADDTAVVLLPLQEWSAVNGLFCTTMMVPGQDICLGGAEEVVFPGTGGCLILLLILKLPRRQDLES